MGLVAVLSGFIPLTFPSEPRQRSAELARLPGIVGQDQEVDGEITGTHQSHENGSVEAEHPPPPPCSSLSFRDCKSTDGFVSEKDQIKNMK